MNLLERIKALTEKCLVRQNLQQSMQWELSARQASEMYTRILDDWRPTLESASAMSGADLIESPYPKNGKRVAMELRQLATEIQSNANAAKDNTGLISSLKEVQNAHRSQLEVIWRDHCESSMPSLLTSDALEKLESAFPEVSKALDQTQQQLQKLSTLRLPNAMAIQEFKDKSAKWQRDLEETGIDDPEVKAAFVSLIKGDLSFADINGDFKDWLEANGLLDQCKVKL
jgi:hypothetical protein